MPIFEIGPAAIDRSTIYNPNRTLVFKDLPATGSGIIATAEIWAVDNMDGVRVGTFFTTNGDILKCRDSETIGAVTSGSKQTFSGLTITVQTDDYWGSYWTSGTVETDATAGLGNWFFSGEAIDPNDEETYTSASQQLSFHGLAEVAPAAPGGSPLATMIAEGII